jgi:hypothetical protein
MGTSPVALCREGRCEPCPPGQRCFSTNTLDLDVRLSGDVELLMTFTDGAGRSFQSRHRFRVQPALDANGDGMPDRWAGTYALQAPFYPNSGPQDDADGDGVSNIDEYRRGTNPRARYVRYFADASNGDRAPGLQFCFTLSRLSPRGSGDQAPESAWITMIGDDGRRIDGAAGIYYSLRPVCLLERWQYPADRVVAAIVESEVPFAAERLAAPTDVRSFDFSFVGSAGVESPSTQWYFADGGADGEPDAFYLAYNPGSRPVDATFTYRRADGRLLLRRVRTLEPGRRTTVWVNADDAPIARTPAFTEITSSAPILVERAWRFNPPGRTVTQALASPGTATPSARWIFPDVDGRDDGETTVVVANPSARDAIVDVSLLYDDRDERSAGAALVPAGGRTTIPVRLLAGLAGTRASMELTSRDGVRVVAERTRRGRDATGPWRLSMAGAPQAGAEWTIPALQYASSLVFTNVSNEPATLELHSEIADTYADNPIRLTVTVPPRRRVTYNWPSRPGAPRDPATPDLNSGTLRIMRGQAERGRADLVVELVRSGRADGALREPASGTLGFRVR